ncbi:ATP-dependent DNA helicase RecG [Anaerovorax odorimutans]|uniref:ATP-dependent DNA helicase RecG n=1 Tax=Anaerovorax odorimutans TaxID=109327 RepID=A0ABT1RQD7_9FIRM|nr:ATP-dependent DNA helicase RecG [Anaerovorax odorimutans]MCQ4637409.1 ATP-dependent DNA helicase RecG [Anaerovorax odorimutans]
MELTEKVTVLKGIGPKKAQALEKLEIRTIEDLLTFFPRDYEDRRAFCAIADLQEDRPAFVRAKIELVIKDPYRRGKKQILRLLVSDNSGRLEVVFFNARYLADTFKVGKQFDFFGKPSVNYGKTQMIHPDFSVSEKGLMQGILPVYPLTSGISQKEMRLWQKTALSAAAEMEEYLPEDLILRNRLCDLEYAVCNVHFPKDKKPLLQGKYRLIFDELLALQTGLLASKQKTVGGKNGLVFSKEADVKEYIGTFSYELTGAQERVVAEITEDLESGRVMNRLVQGDVGSGKTAVAEIALYKAVRSGFQGVLMAPTELLAKQHYAGLSRNFADHEIRVGMLTGSMTAREKREVLEQLASGEIQILVGTHAIIQPDVVFHKLGLVITDEQHRFGVKQRAALSEKGDNPHVLVMTATPIPRTLAVILYGDLDVSVIDELPPGRQKIITRAVDENQRDHCYGFVEKELRKGRQAYVVAPLIDESEVLDVKSAEELYEELKARFADQEVALLHGAMKQQQKDAVMTQFYENRIQVLVSTVVIEVGINVPNATIMVIENAERFGLAQLHQLRGRVGRGSHQSYCVLISKGTSEIALQRAQIMADSQDGFYIAEQDLALRGPGEIFGTRQHGVPDLSIADLAKHIKILNDVKKEADLIISEDPFLESEKYAGLKKRIAKLFGEDFSLKL